MANEGTFTADGDSGWVLAKGDVWMHASGSLGLGTLSFEFQGADGNAHALPDPDAEGNLFYSCGESVPVRISLSGATVPSIYWHIKSDATD